MAVIGLAFLVACAVHAHTQTHIVRVCKHRARTRLVLVDRGVCGDRPEPPHHGRNPRSASHGIGSTGTPAGATTRCRCGPVELPVEPTAATGCPIWTRSPTATSTRERCP